MPYLFLCSLFLFAVLRIGLYQVELKYADQVDLVTNFPISSQIYDRNGGLLYEFFDEVRRIPVPSEEIPDHLIRATLMAEDENFFLHAGFDPLGILRAAWRNWRAQEVVEGGSTLGQQLVKNTVLGPSEGYQDKIEEIFFSVAVDARLSKQDIVHLYLNTIPYGSNVYGAEAASRYYFGKPVKEISLNESAILAALPKHPTYLSPFGDHVDELRLRKNYILTKMYHAGYITEEAYKDAFSSRMLFASPEMPIRAPHFVMMVRKDLEQKLGKQMLYEGGLLITTTLDPYMQYQAEGVVDAYSDHLQKYQADSIGIVSLDPKTGELLTLVGNKDYFDKEHSGNFNMATALRQPGSTFKPLVYASLLDKKTYTPASILWDVKKNFGTKRDPYIPQNYDLQYRGPVTVRDSLAMSLNVPAVQALTEVGVETVLDVAEDLGITSLDDRKRFGPSLVLGGGEVQLLEMTGAFATFANYGTKEPITTIQQIETIDGVRLPLHRQEEHFVMYPETAFQITSILSDNRSRTPVFGARSPLAFPDLTVAAKTGTTQDYRDAWTIGYSPSLAVGVWVGNHDNMPLRYGAAGSIVAGPIWREVFDRYLEQYPQEVFSVPDGLNRMKIKTRLGLKEEYVAPWQIDPLKRPLVHSFSNDIVIP